MEEMKTCCFTGLRPERLPFKKDEGSPDGVKLKALIRQEIERLIREEGVVHFISGMDIGTDLISAGLVLELKEEYPQITLESAIPYEEQAIRWNMPQRERYYEIAGRCDESIMLQTAYTHGCRKNCSRYMAGRSGYVLAVWDGAARTESGWMVRHAQSLGRTLIIIDPVKLEITREKQPNTARE